LWCPPCGVATSLLYPNKQLSNVAHISVDSSTKLEGNTTKKLHLVYKKIILLQENVAINFKR
jgi:hypothetical protein